MLILSDNDGLARAIKLLLARGDLRAERFGPGHFDQLGNQAQLSEWDLIVVAMSSPASEPAVALSGVSRVEQIGQTPLLIISDRSCHSDLDDMIVHLDFPFDVDELYDRVGEILCDA